MRAARLIAGLVLAVGATVGYSGIASAAPPPWVPAPPFGGGEPADPALDLVGTWGLDLVDVHGICVSILVPEWVPDRDAHGQAIVDAVDDWITAVNASASNDLVWTEDTEGAWDGPNESCRDQNAGQVDVTVELRRGGGRVQGTTTWSFEDGAQYVPPSEGLFINGARIEIRGKFAGTDNLPSDVGLIARHEFGHALGLGHWNVEGELMSPVLVEDTTAQPNGCEVAAVLAANDWYTSGASGPAPYDPTDDPYICNP